MILRGLEEEELGPKEGPKDWGGAARTSHIGTLRPLAGAGQINRARVSCLTRIADPEGTMAEGGGGERGRLESALRASLHFLRDRWAQRGKTLGHHHGMPASAEEDDDDDGEMTTPSPLSGLEALPVSLVPAPPASPLPAAGARSHMPAGPDAERRFFRVRWKSQRCPRFLLLRIGSQRGGRGRRGRVSLLCHSRGTGCRGRS